MYWIFLLIFIVVLIAAVALFKRSGGTVSGGIMLPYQPTKSLFTPAERLFLEVLDQAVGQSYRVFGKVRVADVASVRAGLDKSARQGALNRIAAKHFDYVVCRLSDLSIVCAVELNDKSHASKKARTRDELLANVCRVIQLPLVIVTAKVAYSTQEVRDQFLAATDSDARKADVTTRTVS